MRWQTMISQWAGFEHHICVQSGTSAMTLVLDALFQDFKPRITIPALCCWTIPSTLAARQYEVRFRDTDNDLRICSDDWLPEEAVVAVEPWGGATIWPQIGKCRSKKIIDLTLSVLGTWEDKKAADYFDAGFISLGKGKSLDIGAGGIALFKHREDFERAHEQLLFGRQRLQWVRNSERYVFSEHLYASLDTAIGLQAARQGQLHDHYEDWHKAICQHQLPLYPILPNRDESVRPGNCNLLPVMLKEDYPLNAEDLYRVATASIVPLILQPVSPAYLEPAWKGETAYCPNAERITKRLLFLPLTADPGSVSATLKALFDALAHHPDHYTFPYRIDGAVQELPVHYQYLKRFGIVGRHPDGTFRVLDQLHGKMFHISAAIAKSLQT